MLKASLALAIAALLAVACASSNAAPSASTPTTIATRLPAATTTPAPSATSQPTKTPTALPQPTRNDTRDPVPTPTFFSEVLGTSFPLPPPVTQKPIETPVPGGTSLPIPDGTTVVWGGCASDGECHWFNFYWAPTHEVVMQAGESPLKVQHELCHAHQHWSINGGAALDPSDYDLESWYTTTEGASFLATVEGLAWPWSHSAVNGLEDFAWTCANWYLQPERLLNLSPERYAWAAANLP